MALSPRKLRFVEAYAQGASASDAARTAGYSERHARGRAYTLLKDPQVAEAINEIRREVQKRSVYGIEQAIAEANDLLRQAKELKQMTAAANLFTTKMKLLNFLSDRVVVELPSLTAALEAARARAGVGSRPIIPQVVDVTPRRIERDVFEH